MVQKLKHLIGVDSPPIKPLPKINRKSDLQKFDEAQDKNIRKTVKFLGLEEKQRGKKK